MGRPRIEVISDATFHAHPVFIICSVQARPITGFCLSLQISRDSLIQFPPGNVTIPWGRPTTCPTVRRPRNGPARYARRALCAGDGGTERVREPGRCSDPCV